MLSVLTKCSVNLGENSAFLIVRVKLESLFGNLGIRFTPVDFVLKISGYGRLSAKCYGVGKAIFDQ
jgi:hypothetical protein